MPLSACPIATNDRCSRARIPSSRSSSRRSSSFKTLEIMECLLALDVPATGETGRLDSAARKPRPDAEEKKNLLLSPYLHCNICTLQMQEKIRPLSVFILSDFAQIGYGSIISKL